MRQQLDRNLTHTALWMLPKASYIAIRTIQGARFLLALYNKERKNVISQLSEHFKEGSYYE